MCILLLFMMPPKNNNEELSSVLKYKKVVMCLTKKIQGQIRFHSDVSYGVVGCEFNVNESILFIKEGAL